MAPVLQSLWQPSVLNLQQPTLRYLNLVFGPFWQCCTFAAFKKLGLLLGPKPLAHSCIYTGWGLSARLQVSAMHTGVQRPSQFRSSANMPSTCSPGPISFLIR